MLKVLDKFLGIPLFRNALKLSLSSVFTIGSSIAVTPILSRLFSPEEYGEWGVFSSVVVIVDCVICLSYENAIVKSQSIKELSSIICLCSVTSIILSILTTVAFYTGKLLEIPFFVNFPCVGLLFIALLLGGGKTISSFVSNRLGLYNSLSLGGAIMGGSQALNRVVFGLVNIKPGLILGNLLATLLSTLYLFKELKIKSKKNLYDGVSYGKIKSVAIKYRKFPLYDAPSQLISFTLANIIIIILSLYFSMDEIGSFSMVSQLVLIPVTVLGISMQTVYLKELSNVQYIKDEIRGLTSKVIGVCFPLSCIPTLFLILGGDLFLVYFLGEDWALTSKMSFCVSIFSIPIILSEPLLPIFKILDKQDVLFKLNVLNLLLTIVSLYIGIFFNFSILVVLIVYSVVTGICRFLMFAYQLKLADLNLLSYSKQWLAIVAIYVVLSFKLIIVMTKV